MTSYYQVPSGMQLPRQPHVRLVIIRILQPPHPARPAGRRNPPPRFRSASPPPGSPPAPNPRRSSAPRPAASCLPFVATHSRTMPPAPQDSRRDALGIALRERRSCRRQRRLARPPPGATASSAVLVIPGASALLSSFVQLGHSCGIT